MGSEEKKRVIAYLCPKCHQTVLIDRTVFQLAAAPSHLPCPCGKSAISIDPMGDRSILKIPCVACGKEHTADCRTDSLLRQRCLAFSCSTSGLNCCYIGDEGVVEQAARRMEETLDKLEAEKEDRGTFLDPVIMEEVLSELKDIARRDGISCTCGSHQWHLQVHYSSVDLTCAKCGGVLRLSAATDQDLEDLCCCYTLQIQGAAAEQ